MADTVPAIPSATPMTQMTPGSEDADRNARLAAKYNISTDETPVVVDNTPPPTDAPDTPAVVDPATPPPVTPSADKGPNASAAARRVAEKKENEELIELRRKLAELEPKLPDLETKAVEYKTRADQLEAEAKELRDRYQNEVNSMDPALVSEVPVVREAYNKYNDAASRLFPVDISNPADDEPDMRFDPSSLTPEKNNIVRAMIDRWAQEEFQGKGAPKDRADVQHVVLSNIAAAMGVDKEKFQTKVINGQEYQVIHPSHPVYKHLKQEIRPFVQARQAVAAAEEEARGGRMESMKSVVGTRVQNTKKMIRDAGVGVTGDDLKNALATNPESATLRTMSLLESEPELLQELRDAIETEAAINGHFRPQLDLLDTDVKARNTAAQTYLTRIGLRAVNAPMAPVLMKLSLKQQAKISDLQAEIEKLKEENSRTLIQAEPGGMTSPSGGGGASSAAQALSPSELKLAQKYNITI